MAISLLGFSLKDHFSEEDDVNSHFKQSLITQTQKNIDVVEAKVNEAPTSGENIVIPVGSNNNYNVVEAVDELVITEKDTKVLVVKDLILDDTTPISASQFENLRTEANFAFVGSVNDAVEIINDPAKFENAQAKTWELVHQAYA